MLNRPAWHGALLPGYLDEVVALIGIGVMLYLLFRIVFLDGRDDGPGAPPS